MAHMIDDDQPITPMPEICTLFGCGGKVRINERDFYVCVKCGSSYGPAEKRKPSR